MSNVEQYPRFADGDVVIVAPTGHSWKLHSHILSQFSPTFRQLLQKDRGHISKKQKTDGKPGAQWKFLMVVTDPSEYFIDFRPVDLSIRQPMSLPVSINAIGGRPEYLTTYDNLFRCIYNLDPDLDHKGDGNSLTHRSVTLIRAAQRIHAIGPVRRVIESHLLRLGQVLWDRVQSMPPLFADLAIRLESPGIFKEAMVHIIGTWSFPNGMSHVDVSENSVFSGHARTIKALAAKKVAELDEWKKSIESRLVEFIPPILVKQAIDGKKPGRAEYANDIYLWQALALIRQHITVALMNKQGRLALDGGATFYRQINLGGDAYLRPPAIEAWLQNFPMTHKGLQKFECATIRLKEEYRDLTVELMVNNGQPFAANAPFLGYLTVAKITEEDFPWLEEGTKIKPSSLLFSEVPDRASPAASNPFPATPRRYLAATAIKEGSATPQSVPRYLPTGTSSAKAKKVTDENTFEAGDFRGARPFASHPFV